MRFDISDRTPATVDEILEGLDSDQRAAVTAPPGVVVVRAGAGSGKTTVLTRRVAWRVATESASPDHVLAITFTRQAATEMRTRLRRFGIDGNPQIHTFHALGLRLLTQRAADAGRAKPLVVTNRMAVLSGALGADAKQSSLPGIANAIDHATVRMLGGRDLDAAIAQSGIQREVSADQLARIMERYEESKRKRGVVDTNDLIAHVVRDARRDARFVQSMRHQFRHVSVDEAQDMNPLQYELLRLLVPDAPDLFVVGDPNQAIYGFNGADNTLFDELPGLGAGARVVTLPSNYRCTPQVVDAASRFLRNGGQHIEAESRRPDGRAVSYIGCENEFSERNVVARELRRMRDACGTWNLLAVLVRVNALGDDIGEFLASQGIPVRSGRRGPEWSAAIAQATSLTSRETLSIWSSDVLDSGDYEPSGPEYEIAAHVRTFLDDNRSGSVDGRAFGSWLTTSVDRTEVEGVEVMTFHAAKGREWYGVVVAAAETGYLPHSSARSAAQKAEEARLGYVALTRAADDLVVTWAKKRRNRARTRSPLLPVDATVMTSRRGPGEDVRRISGRAPKPDALTLALREWREDMSRRSGLSANGILTDSHIRQITTRVPRTITELADVIDMAFATRHGESLLAVVARVNPA